MAIANKPVYGFNNAKDKVEVPAMSTGKMMIQKKIYTVQMENDLPGVAAGTITCDVSVDRSYEENVYNRDHTKATAVISLLGVSSGKFHITDMTITKNGGTCLDATISIAIENDTETSITKPTIKFSVAWFN